MQRPEHADCMIPDNSPLPANAVNFSSSPSSMVSKGHKSTTLHRSAKGLPLGYRSIYLKTTLYRSKTTTILT